MSGGNEALITFGRSKPIPVQYNSLFSAWLEKALYRCGRAKRQSVLEARHMLKRVSRWRFEIQDLHV